MRARERKPSAASFHQSARRRKKPCLGVEHTPPRRLAAGPEGRVEFQRSRMQAALALGQPCRRIVRSQAAAEIAKVPLAFADTPPERRSEGGVRIAEPLRQ